MERLTAGQVVDRLKGLPSLPSVVSDLLRSFDDENVDVGSVARQIAQDQALTAKVLRVANSAFYGLQNRVGSIQEAVVVLGFNSVRGMVLGTGISGVFQPERCPGFDLDRYARDSITVGLAARAMAGEAGLNGELAFTTGILHDIGRLVLASCFAERYSPALLAGGGSSLASAVEREVLGIDHAEVGGLLAETWHFPPVLRDAVRFHHAVPASTSASPTITDLIHVADALAHGFGRDGASGVVPDPQAVSRLGLDEEKMVRVLARVDREMDEAFAAFGNEAGRQ